MLVLVLVLLVVVLLVRVRLLAPGRAAQNWSDLVWRYSARPCGPSSRPTPDCL